MQEMLEYLIKLFRFKIQAFNHQFLELNLVIRYLALLINNLKERPGGFVPGDRLQAADMERRSIGELYG